VAEQGAQVAGSHSANGNLLRDRMIAKGAKPGNLIFHNTIGGVEGHFLRKLQAIAERAGVTEPELHRFRKSYADTLADEGCLCPRS
jgi:hypothetical protein